MGGGESNAMRVAILDQVNGLYLGDGMPVLLYLQCQACSFAAPAAEAGNLLLIIAHLIQHQRAKFLQDAEEAAELREAKRRGRLRPSADREASFRAPGPLQASFEALADATPAKRRRSEGL